jgi:DNA-binding NtrC family response regulator
MLQETEYSPTLSGTEAGNVIRKDLKTLLEDYERSLILDALAATGGNQRQAAFALGVLPTTLHEKLKRLRIRALEPLAPQALAALQASK